MPEEQIIQEILTHVTKLNEEFGQIQVSVAILQTQMETIVWWFRVLGAAVIGMLVSQVWQIGLMQKNNKPK